MQHGTATYTPPSHFSLFVKNPSIAAGASLVDLLLLICLVNYKLCYRSPLVVENKDLTMEEHNHLSVAYKNMIGAHRVSWRIVSSIDQKEESHGNEDHIVTIKEYKGTIKTELNFICNGNLKLLESNLTHSPSASNSKVFYLKMKGYYYCYLAEFKIVSERKVASDNTLAAYKSD